MDSRPRQKRSGMTFLRGEHPSYWKEILGGMTDDRMDSRLRGNDGVWGE
jgi:hypothetical protein